MSERPRAALGNRYRIERELGQGGMATVYLAQDLVPTRGGWGIVKDRLFHAASEQRSDVWVMEAAAA